MAAEVIAGLDVEFDAKTIPSVAYTDPEVAWMGLTETRAKAEEIAYEKAIFPWSASGRALGWAATRASPSCCSSRGRGPCARRRDRRGGRRGPHRRGRPRAGDGRQRRGHRAHDPPAPTLSETIALAAELQDGTITDLISPAVAKARRSAAR